MTIQLQKVQYKYDNTTAKSIIQVWQHNCKKYNIRVTIQLHIVQYAYDKRTAKMCNTMYDNTTAKSTIYV